MQGDKLAALEQIINSVDKKVMFSKKGRKALVKLLCKRLELWEPVVVSFVEEMRGLNFSKLEDRQAFIQFAEVGL